MPAPSGPYLKTLLDQTGIATTDSTTRRRRVSPGPTSSTGRRYMRQIVPQANPDIVVVTFGGNDAQGLRNVDKTLGGGPRPGVGRRRRRLEGRVRQAGGRGDGLPHRGQPHAHLGGHPQRRQPRGHRAHAGAGRGGARRGGEARRTRWCSSTRGQRFSGRNGGWAEYVIDPATARARTCAPTTASTSTTTGAEILALDIAEAVPNDLRARGATI